MEELAKLWQMYVEECRHRHVKADMSQFTVWLEEKYF
jgi:hypothetical protein